MKYAAFDQLSKWWVKSILVTKPGYTMSLAYFLDFVYSWNHGVSFGMFREYHDLANKVFMALSTAIVLYVWNLLLNSLNYRFYVGYSLIIGGAVGNLIDRFRDGAVFDFIYFHYGDWYFPAFNLADSFIFLGAVTVMLAHYKNAKDIAKEKEAEYDAEAEKFAEEADEIRKLDAESAMNKNNIQDTK